MRGGGLDFSGLVGLGGWGMRCWWSGRFGGWEMEGEGGREMDFVKGGRFLGGGFWVVGFGWSVLGGRFWVGVVEFCLLLFRRKAISKISGEVI